MAPGARLLVVLSALVLTLGASQAGAGLLPAGPQVVSRASPMDGGTATGLSGLTYPTLPFGLGEVDLLTLGVSDAELADAGLAGPSAAAAAHGDKLVVDDDLADCPNADYTTIQSAVTAANPNDTIEVCRGTYVEQVTIPASKDDLELRGKPHLQAVIKAPALMVDPKAIVRVNGAQDVKIKDFTITGPGGFGCDSLRWGVRIDMGGSAKIEHNHITLIRDTPFSGCQNGIGILVGRMFEGQTATAEIKHNLIDAYQKGGIVVDNAGSYAKIEKNEVTGPGPQPTIAPNGIQVSRGAGADLDHNKVTGNAYTGAVFAGTGVLIFQAGTGIVEIDHNKVFENDDGISLYDTDQALVKHNKSEDQFVYDGLFADMDSSGNRFEGNDAKDNAEHDCHDDSTGTGTAGTANFWIKNKGETQNRPGLCKKAEVT
jgi:nitrous oxidase accessory protein NosD